MNDRKKDNIITILPRILNGKSVLYTSCDISINVKSSYKLLHTRSSSAKGLKTAIYFRTVQSKS